MKIGLVNGILLVILGIWGTGVIIKGLTAANWMDNWTGFDIGLIIIAAVLAISLLVFMVVVGKFMIDDSCKDEEN